MQRRRRTNQALPPNLYRDKKGPRYYYVYRNPRTGQRTGMGTDKMAACAAANKLNWELRKPDSEAEELVNRATGGAETMGSWLDRYWEIFEEREPAANTKRTRKSHVKAIRAAFGSRRLTDIATKDVAMFVKSIADSGKHRTAQAVRSTLLDIFRTGQEEGVVFDNPVAVTRQPKADVKRSRITLDQFHIVMEHAKDGWQRNSMLLAVVTLQRLEDVSRMQFRDIQDGWIHIRQHKTGAMLRISIDIRLDALGLSIADAISRCRDRVVSPRLIHHAKAYGNAPLGAAVHPATISRAFTAAVRASGLTWDGTPPTFHELRSLGIRLYKAQGYDPQHLAGHKDSRMTDVYRDARGAEWLEVTG